MNKLRDNAGLRFEVKRLIAHSWDSSDDEASVTAILDAVDRALTGPSPSPPTCKQSLQVDPGTGGGAATTCETCKGVREVLWMYNRGPGSPPGNQMIPCPTCRPFVALAPAVPAAEPGKPATCPDDCAVHSACRSSAETRRLGRWVMAGAVPPFPEGEPPAKCATCKGRGWHGMDRATCTDCGGVGRATPEKGGTR